VKVDGPKAVVRIEASRDLRATRPGSLHGEARSRRLGNQPRDNAGLTIYVSGTLAAREAAFDGILDRGQLVTSPDAIPAGAAPGGRRRS
jgi:hypothetical protein